MKGVENESAAARKAKWGGEGPMFVGSRSMATDFAFSIPLYDMIPVLTISDHNLAFIL